MRVPKAFYQGFPQSVRKLTKNELLFDQLLHYIQTYGFDNFDEPKYFVMEENFQRTAFKEKAVPKNFDIVNEEDGVKELDEYVKNLLSSTRPLNDYQYEAVAFVTAMRSEKNRSAYAAFEKAIFCYLHTQTTYPRVFTRG